MSKPIFYQGQEVGCLMYGEGVILEMDSKNVCVRFDGGTEEFDHDGQYMQHLRPTLYPIDQYREIIANLPAPQPEAWKPKQGEWCWFWDDNTNGCAVLSMLKSYHAESAYAFETAVGSRYKNCAPFTGELPPHLKEVQP